MDREPDTDTTLVELLYGELDGDARARAEARIAADPSQAAELDGLRAMRGTMRSWAEATDAEPSRGVADLMAAARASARPVAVAAEPAPGPGLWERITRWMAPLFAHPGLAAAMTLVVVAGVAGTFYIKGGSSGFVEATAPAQTTAVHRDETSAPAAPPAPSPESQRGVVVDLYERAPAEAESAPMVKPKTEARPRKAPAADDLDVDSFDGVVTGGNRGAAESKKSAKASAPTARDVAPDTAEAAASGAAAPTKAPAVDAPRPAPTPASAPEPAAESAPPPPPRAPSPTTTGAPADRKQERSDGSEIGRLTRDARTAAGRADCALVRKLSERVRALDAAYHQRVFRGDKAIAACLAVKK